MKFNYIDPGTGSMLISAVIAMISVAFFVLKGVIYKSFGIGGSKGESVDLEKHYNLVFFSEGKQYWNVFKPLVEGCSESNIESYYFTSDENDPGLKCEYENIKSFYIGSGREAYYILNRLKANMVVMTTPGLDVLEIKRSPHVKHYSHIGHATSSVASYKAYGTDYFDSVLIGGEAEVSLIRELETVRSLPKKDIEVVGHPYLDELRLKMADIDEDKFFDNDLKTILVSPTWGNHGLLTLYGEELLNELLKGENYNIILRPHPQSFVSDKSIMDFLQKEFPNTEHLIWDRNIDNIKSMSQADLMISDFSGIIFDFFTLYKRPIITMNGQYEKRGRDAMDLKEDPWDLQSLDKIGRTINQEDVPNITKIIEEAMLNVESDSEVTKEVLQKMDTFPRESKERSLTYIKQQLAIINENIEIENTTDNYLLQKNHLETVTIKTLVPFLFSTQMFFQYVIASVYLFVISYICGVMLPKKGLNQIYFSKLFPDSYF